MGTREFERSEKRGSSNSYNMNSGPLSAMRIGCSRIVFRSRFSPPSRTSASTLLLWTVVVWKFRSATVGAPTAGGVSRPRRSRVLCETTLARSCSLVMPSRPGVVLLPIEAGACARNILSAAVRVPFW